MVTITKAALVARVQRALAKDNQKLVASRGTANIQALGNYYIVDLSNNSVVSHHCELIKLATELGCVKPYESLHE